MERRRNTKQAWCIKYRLYLLFILVCKILCSTTWHIKLDGPAEFITIQESIDAPMNSDTVLVNLDGKNVY